MYKPLDLKNQMVRQKVVVKSNQGVNLWIIRDVEAVEKAEIASLLRSSQ